MKKNLVILSGFGLAFAPLFAFAQSPTSCATASGKIQGIICVIHNIINFVMPVLVALGVLYFVWGVISYVIAKDEEVKKRGKDKMIYGIIGLVVIVGMWGLVGIINNTFGLSGTTSYTIPGVPVGPITP